MNRQTVSPEQHITEYDGPESYTNTPANIAIGERLSAVATKARRLHRERRNKQAASATAGLA
jgi:hypothetical protein